MRTKKKPLKSLNDAQAEIDGLTHYEKFSTGFKIGAMLMAEVFIGMEMEAR